MKIVGQLTRFNRINNGAVITKNTIIDNVPGKIPITYGFGLDKCIIGCADVQREDTGLILTGTIYERYEDIISELCNEGCGLGGYYNKVVKDIDVVDSCTLRSCSITSNPCDKECKFEIIK